jgi:hypothetical protein
MFEIERAPVLLRHAMRPTKSHAAFAIEIEQTQAFLTCDVPTSLIFRGRLIVKGECDRRNFDSERGIRRERL